MRPAGVFLRAMDFKPLTSAVLQARLFFLAINRPLLKNSPYEVAMTETGELRIIARRPCEKKPGNSSAVKTVSLKMAVVSPNIALVLMEPGSRS